MKHGSSHLKISGYLQLVLITIALSSIFPGIAQAANKYHNRANAWCADYTRQHPGQQCRVVHRGKLCPKGFMRSHRFGHIARGYKSCIPGKKGTIIKQGMKKAVNAAANLTPGLLLTSYRSYFKRIDRHAHGSTHLSSKFIEHYQRYYKNDLKKVVISESSEVPTNTAMTDCHHIYFPVGSGMRNKISTYMVMATDGAHDDTKRWLLHELTHTEQCSHAGGRNNYALRWFGQTGGGLIRTLASGNYHMNIANQIHDKNPMEKAAEAKAQRLRYR